jgi:hypothetical protein
MKKSTDSWIVIAILVLFVAAIGGCEHWYNNDQKAKCRDQGGTVVISKSFGETDKITCVGGR